MRAHRLLATALLAAALLLAGAGPGSADPPRLLVSTDGRAWRADLARPLFDPAQLWVPGDAASSTFWVRNQSGDPTRLWLRALAHGDDELLRAPGLRLAVRAGGSRWIDVTDGTTHELPGLAAGATTTVEARATFDSASTNVSQRRTAALDLDVLITGDPAPGQVPGGTKGPLAHTGAEPLPAAASGVLLVALGLVLRPRRRTQTRRSAHASSAQPR